MSGWYRCQALGPALLLALAVVTAPRVALADDGDPPERVAYVDVVEGAAAVQPSGQGDWTGDIVNRPLTSGDRLWVDAGSRAEAYLGSTAIRAGANTAVQFLEVGNSVSQLQVSSGTVNVRLRYLSPDETFEVDTPNVAVTLTEPGEYRIDVGDSGDVVAVSVWRGAAEVAGQTQSFSLQAQQQGQFSGTDTLAVDFSDVAPGDAFDQWVENRDRREDDRLSANFVARDVSGYAALDDYGDWQSDPQYGSLWVPQVQAGWAPYSVGYWAWIVPWGWTWVDAEPWGFAPFHYGRWVHPGGRWAWCPGQFSVRPVYAPALVVFGFGPGGEVVWFPLGYNETYLPSRHVSAAYLQRVNVTNTYLGNTTTIDPRQPAPRGGYANQQVAGAMVASDRTGFAAARRPAGIATPAVAAAVTLVAANTIAPGARSRAPLPDARHAVATPPRVVFARTVTVRRPPRTPGPAAAMPRVVVTTVAPVPPRPQGHPMPEPPARPSVPPRSPSAVTVPAVPAMASPPAAPVPRTDRPAVMPRVTEPVRPVEPPRPMEPARPAVPIRPVESVPPRVDVERPAAGAEPRRPVSSGEGSHGAAERPPAKVEH